MAHHRGARDEELAEAPVQYAPAAPTSADELEHLAQLHASGVLTDEEFATAKSKVLGS
jgi:Short C-terminal domain